jgi:phosphoribosylaminoimidazole carboxylase PurE protein
MVFLLSQRTEMLKNLRSVFMSVAVVMGSKSDLDIVRGAFDVLKEFGIPFTGRVLSAHRTPEEAAEFAANAEKDGVKIIICAAGMAAHLGGVIAAHTTLPVIGIPVASAPFNGLDALFSIVQMPPGIPVAAVTAGKAGGKNAALYAISILALSDSSLAEKLKAFRLKQKEQVLAADLELQKELAD